MKKFLITTSLFLVIALLFVVSVFVLLNLSFSESPVEPKAVANETVLKSDTFVSKTTPALDNVAEQEMSEVPEKVGIPLSDIPLSDTQKDTLDMVGVDADTFVVTPAMEVCAREKLGDERLADIVTGSAPTVMETARLLPCLGE